MLLVRRPLPREISLSGLALLVLFGACTGDIMGFEGSGSAEDPGEGRGTGPGPGQRPPGSVTPPGAGPGSTQPTRPGPSAQACGVTPTPWRRLTNFEYENTVRDLFPGVDLGAGIGAQLPPDTVRSIFDNEASAQGVSAALLESYLKTAERISAVATQDLPRLLGCSAGAGEDACVETFLDGFAPRAFRRPLADEERTRLLATYRTTKADGGLRFGVEASLQRLLVSPQFLYRTEGSTGNAGRVDAHAVASRLSYALWAGPPDAELSAAAKAGKLADAAELTKQVDRLLADNRSWVSFGKFYDQLFHLSVVPDQSKDKTLYPKFNEGVAKAMHEETVAFLRHITYASDARTDDLLSAPYSFLNATLAGYYGVPGPAGAALEKTMLDPTRHAGLLSQGSFATQTAHEKTTSPIERGKFVRVRLMCDVLPEPPDDIPAAPMFTGKETMRELLAKHSREPSCRGCHQLIDPVGLGLENLDPAGRWRDMELGGQPVDASGEIVGGDAPGPFKGPAELGRRLASSARARGCLTEKLFAYVMGRAPTDADACALKAIEAAREKEGGGMRALLRAMVTSEPFLSREFVAGGTP